MLDKYGDTIYCTRCRREIEDKKDLHIDHRGIVYCTKCFELQEFEERYNIDGRVLGHRNPTGGDDDYTDQNNWNR